jgi:hypothetical protein
MDPVSILMGGIVSTIMQFFKVKDAPAWVNSLVVVGLSFFAAIGVYLAQQKGLWDPFWQIVTMSATFYAFIYHNIEKSNAV